MIGILLGSAVRALLLAGVTGLMLAVFRPKRSATRHVAWTLVLVASLAMPALTTLLPARPIEVPIAPLAATQRSHESASASGLTAQPPTARDTSRERRSITESPAQTQPAAKLPLNISTAVLVIYALVAFLLLGRLAIGWLTARRVLRVAVPLDDAVALENLRAATATLNITRLPRLLESSSVVVPIAISSVHPAIILPAGCQFWTAEARRAVFTHELAHIARRDLLTQRVALIHNAVFWFSPLAWWLPVTLARLSDEACDDAVLERGIDRTSYAETVLGFLAALNGEPRRARWTTTVAVVHESRAAQRIERILAWTSATRSPFVRWQMASMLVVALPAIGWSAVTQVVVTSSALVPSVEPRPIVVPTLTPLADPPLTIVPPTRSTEARAPEPVVLESATSDTQTAQDLPTTQELLVTVTIAGSGAVTLKQSDFRLYEDGNYQTIDSVSDPEIEHGRTSANWRAFVIFIDDINIPPANAAALRHTLETIRDQIGPADLVGIVSSGYSSVEKDLRYNTGGQPFNEAIAKVMSSAMGPPPLRIADRENYIMLTSLRTTRDALARLASRSNLVVNMLYVGPGYAVNVFKSQEELAALATLPPSNTSPGAGITEADLVSWLADVIRTARRAGTKIYTVNPTEGPAGADGTPSLRALANLTGGFCICVPADLTSGLQRIADDTARDAQWPVNYTLHYRSRQSPTKLIGRVGVQVARPGLVATIIGITNK